MVLVTGPSGVGKSLFAQRTGLPVLRLDDFYKEGHDPTLPLLPDGSAVDWDSPLSWDADAAMEAVLALATTGRAEPPRYDISTSSRVGVDHVDLGEAPAFVAEGIFAAELIARCREHGVLAEALCLRGKPMQTFRRRLWRDLREGRKSPFFLVRRGWMLMRAEHSIVERHRALGARVCGKPEGYTLVEPFAQAPLVTTPVTPPVTTPLSTQG